MLTNAIKHGRRDQPVHVERHWPEGRWDRDLRIEVRNVEDASAVTRPSRSRPPSHPARDSTACGGGWRRSAGGSTYAAATTNGEPTFTATAWVPVRGSMTRHLRSVLLVDDQDLFREGVKVIVDAQEGMSVVGMAGDGLEAVRLVDELSPDVVLMDIRMPEMDGVEATRQIFGAERVGRREKPVRVVVLTTFNLDDRAATAIRHGASGFLLKDTTPAMLRDAIRTVHSGNAVLAPNDLAILLDSQFQRGHPAARRPTSRSPTRSARSSTPWPAGCPTPRSPGSSSRASRRSRPTSARSCASWPCVTGCRSWCSPTSTASSADRRPAVA